ncbi:MAG: hypothetical protein HYV32_05240 [Candidatus Kerfeldbacteria bacterium]|nr:hypothetical protein [Candidatus Kerfeldbacteria bacterium]
MSEIRLERKIVHHDREHDTRLYEIGMLLFHIRVWIMRNARSSPDNYGYTYDQFQDEVVIPIQSVSNDYRTYSEQRREELLPLLQKIEQILQASSSDAASLVAGELRSSIQPYTALLISSKKEPEEKIEVITKDDDWKNEVSDQIFFLEMILQNMQQDVNQQQNIAIKKQVQTQLHKCSNLRKELQKTKNETVIRHDLQSQTKKLLELVQQLTNLFDPAPQWETQVQELLKIVAI